MTRFSEGDRLGAYRIVSLLGEGGMGAVYEARHEPLDRRVAIKTLHQQYARDKQALARFHREAKILSNHPHPSIVQVSDFGESPSGAAYLVMEYLRGQTLRQRLRMLRERNKRMPVDMVLHLAFQVADALAGAHAAGVIHRDIKPDNLMLVADAVAPGGERVKLLDFGIAKLSEGSDDGPVSTDTQAIMGTPQYMSPEQCSGAKGVDGKSDVYALGCVLFEMLAGQPPFIAETKLQLLYMHVHRSPPPLASLAPKVPARVAELVHLLLSKDKDARPDMSQAADAIGKLLKQSGAVNVLRSQPLSSIEPKNARQTPLESIATTNGGAAGQSQMTRAGWSARRSVLLGGSFALLLIGGTLAIRLHSANKTTPLPGASLSPAAAPAPAEDAPAPAAPTQPAAPRRRVNWHIDSQPTGATLLDDSDRVIGKTPFSASHPAERGQVIFSLRQPGYTSATITLDRDRDADKQVVLTQVTPPPLRAPDAKPQNPPAKLRVSAPKPGPAVSKQPPPVKAKRYED